MDKLTQKQESFVQNLFLGMSQREAYLQAGYSRNQSPDVLDIHACELAGADKIVVRLAELNKPIIKKIQASKESKLDRLEEIFSKEPLPERVTARERIFAIAEHNKMAGDYMPDKVDITSGLEELLRRLQGRKELPEGEE